MEEPERSGKRMPAKGVREATESQPQAKTTSTAPAPRPAPRPSASPKPKMAPGVPMAGQSYAKRQADAARRAKEEPSAAQAPAPRPRPAAAAPAQKKVDLDLDEDFDLGDEYEDDEPVVEAPAPRTTETPSKIYSTRRALAEQVNKDVGVKPGETDDGVGMASLLEKREAWKKTVKAKEVEGKSPYVTRWAKVSFFPMLYFVVSLSLLRKIRYEYSDYYSYDPIYLMFGLMVGAIFLVLAATGTMLRARRVRKPIQLKGKATWIGVIVFIGISFYLAFYEGLAYAWMFSIGFLAAGLLIVLIGLALEKSGKGTYWVKDPLEPSEKRWLEFVPIAEG